MYTFEPGLLFDPSTNQIIRNGEGLFYANPGDPNPTPVYDLLESQLAVVRSTEIGLVPPFKSSLPFGYIKFGNYYQSVISYEAQLSGLEAAQSRDAAIAAAASASAAAENVQAYIQGTSVQSTYTKAEIDAKISSLASTGGGGGGFSGTITATQISDATPTGRALVTADSQITARGAIGAVATTDSRLGDTRTPTDGSVTTAKIAAGGISQTAVTGLPEALADRPLKSDTYTIDQVNGLRAALDAKANSALALLAFYSSVDQIPAGAQAGLYGIVTGAAPPAQAADPLFVGASSAASATTVFSLTPPAGTAVNDWVLFNWASNSSDGAATPAELPDFWAGTTFFPTWSQLSSANTTFDRRGEIYAKKMTSQDISQGITITFGGAQRSSGVMVAVRNVASVINSPIAPYSTSAATKAIPTLASTGTKKIMEFIAYCERHTDPSQSGEVVFPTGYVIDPNAFVAHPDASSGGTMAVTARRTALRNGGETLGGGVVTLPSAQTHQFVSTVGFVGL